MNGHHSALWTRVAAAALAIGLAAVPATAQPLTPVKVVLDWAWLPYHAPFLIAQDKGCYKEAGLDVTLEQGRGSATTALLLSQLAITMLAAGLGLAISVALGLAAGAAIAGSRLVDRMLTPWLVIAHAVPKVVIAPLFLVWFGFGLQSEVFFVVAFTFFPVIVNTVTGLKSADPEQLLMVRAMGATPAQILRTIQFPNALAGICAGIKLAITLAPVGAVIGEFVASNAGLGHLLIRAVGDMDTSLAFAAVTVFSVFGVLLWRLAEWVERRVLPWHPSQRETFLLREANT